MMVAGLLIACGRSDGATENSCVETTDSSATRVLSRFEAQKTAEALVGEHLPVPVEPMPVSSWYVGPLNHGSTTVGAQIGYSPKQEGEPLVYLRFSQDDALCGPLSGDDHDVEIDGHSIRLTIRTTADDAVRMIEGSVPVDGIVVMIALSWLTTEDVPDDSSMWTQWTKWAHLIIDERD
jgi:hypothetical protein